MSAHHKIDTELPVSVVFVLITVAEVDSKEVVGWV